MANLTKKEILRIQLAAIKVCADDKSQKPERLANEIMVHYDNSTVEKGLVVGYYKNGYHNIPTFPKY